MIYNNRQQKIAGKIDVSAKMSNWTDWKWQLKNCVTDLNVFQSLLGISFSEDKSTQLKKTMEQFPLSITPYYLSLINRKNFENDPVFKQGFPSPYELDFAKFDMSDPLNEDIDSPVPSVTHRYPDRVLLLVSNMCAMYCRPERVNENETPPSII